MMTSESALLLIENARVWDAEMLVRSVLEGTYKFAFMCVHDDVERDLRVQEYYSDLPDIDRIKKHERVAALLDDVEDPDCNECRPFHDLLLTDEELSSLRQRYPRKLRQALEQRWAFFPLAQALSGSEVPGADAVTRMLHGYGMSSHLLHQDGNAVAMVWEREHRSDERNKAISLTHGARELSDLLNLAIFRAVAAYHLKRMDPTPIFRVANEYKLFAQDLDRAYAEFHDVEYGSAIDHHQ
jgi:hypothetical protein